MYVSSINYASLQNFEMRLLVSTCLSVCPSIDSHLTDFDEISNIGSFQNPVQKIQVSLKSDNYKGYLHENVFTLMRVSR